MADRVAVFIDYQNVYREARRVFGLDGGPSPGGQVQPRLLGALIKRLGPGERVLSEVRIYRGFPSSKHDPKGYAACQRQVAAWSAQPDVTAITRPLNYRDPYSPREKGIDVQLAVDYVRLAIQNKYDIGVIFSADTDLVPAIETVIELKGEQACETAAWVAPAGSPNILRIPSKQILFHYLDAKRYEKVADSTDYNAARRRR